MRDAMKVSRYQAECYHVSNGYDGASIFLRYWPRDDGGSSGYIAVVGSFGSFGHYFGNCGSDFRSFLCGCDKYYLAGKFFGADARVFDCDKTVEALKGQIIGWRRDGSIDREEAREMFDAVKEASHTNSEEGFFTELQQMPKFYDFEVYGLAARMMNPQAAGFFSDLWPGFVAELRSELQACAA
jgi:hypothetical protein